MNQAARRRTALILLILTLLLCLPQRIPAQGADLPERATVHGVIGHPQTHNLSCESRSAADWAAYFGISTSENDILELLPRTDNPDTGFVGNPDGIWGGIPPQSYGVHAAPLAAALRKVGATEARTRVGFGWNEARTEIAAGKPVIVWIIGAMWNGSPVNYQASDGKTATVARFEHSMILVGYSPDLVQVVDAYTGLTESYSLNQFLASWAVLGNMAVVWKGDLPQKAQKAAPAGPGGTYTVQEGDYLANVAVQLGVAWQDLADLNDLPSPYVLYAGQELKVPGEPVKPTATPKPSPTLTPTEDPSHHTVRPGESLLGLAKQYGAAWQELAQLNQIGFPYFIYPGQVIQIPTSSPGPVENTLVPTALPTATATLQPPTQKPTPVPTHTPTDSLPETYTVQRGDYLIDLANRFGLDWHILVDINSIPYPYTIYPEQVLKLR